MHGLDVLQNLFHELICYKVNNALRLYLTNRIQAIKDSRKTMPNTIPPLVCDTPPPIDDLDSDEDLSAPNDSNYDHFDGMFH